MELFNATEKLYGYSALSSLLLAQNREDQSPLHVAVLASHQNIAKILLERGAAVSQAMAEEETALHIAAVTGHLGITKLLIAHDADVNAKNIEGRTPLHKAAAYGKTRVVDYLLEK